MSRLNKLLAKPKEIDIDGEKFNLRPLTVQNIDLIMDMESENKRANALKKIIHITLKTAVPDATDEEIDGISIQHFQTLTNAIMKVNGLNEALPENKPTVQP